MRRGGASSHASGRAVSISDEKPLHMRLGHGGHGCGDIGEFQSQTRSRSTCDFPLLSSGLCDLEVSISDEKPLHMRPPDAAIPPFVILCFNLRREAAPHATLLPLLILLCDLVVSISDEKPLHMRPCQRYH